MIKLFSTHCPKCVVLEKKLKEKNISFKIEENVSVMQELGIMSVPMLSVDSNMLNFVDAVKWVNSQEGVCNEY